MKPTDVLFCIFNYHEAANAEFLYRELRPSVNGLNSSYPFTASSTNLLSTINYQLLTINYFHLYPIPKLMD